MDKNQINDEAIKLKQLLDNIDSDINFDNTANALDDSLLPKSSPSIFRDVEAEKAELEKNANAIVDAIARNYIESDEIYNLENNVAIRKYQATKLSELQFLIDSARDNIATIQQALDGGDINPQMFKAKVDFHSDMRNSLLDREKHMTNVETYWAKKAQALGKEESAEIKKSIEENAVPDVTEETPKQKYTIMDHRTIASTVDEIIKQKSDNAETKKT